MTQDENRFQQIVVFLLWVENTAKRIYTPSIMLSVDTVLRTLKKLYQPPKTFSEWKTPLELVIATVLSAQCTDARVNLVTRELFRKYRLPQDYLRVSMRQLEDDIRPCGLYHNKAKFIRALCAILLKEHNGEVPQTMKELTALPGVGRKTASIVLYAGFDKLEGIAVDTHVLRLALRLGFTRSKDQKHAEADLMRQTPRRDWGVINPLLISHGRAVCTARDRRCERCPFAGECPSSRILGHDDLARTGKSGPKKKK